MLSPLHGIALVFFFFVPRKEDTATASERPRKMFKVCARSYGEERKGERERERIERAVRPKGITATAERKERRGRRRENALPRNFLPPE